MTELARTQPMQRLLQGEVGSGKTLVALRAMLAVVDAGGQAALLAPTEVLAAQHLQTFTDAARRSGPRRHARRAGDATGVALVTGSMSAAAKRRGAAARGLGRGGHRHRHARAAQRRRAVRRPRTGRGRRAAPFRGRAAGGAERQVRDPPARAGDDGDPDPALGGDDGLRRPGDLDPARDPGRAGRRQHRRRGRRAPAAPGSTAPGPDRRGGRAGAAGVRRLRPDLCDRQEPAEADRRRRGRRCRRRPRSRTCSPSWSPDRWPASGSRCCTASCPTRGEGRRDGPVRGRARPTCWSPRR